MTDELPEMEQGLIKALNNAVACIGYSSTNPETTEKFTAMALDIADKIITRKNVQAGTLPEVAKSLIKALNNAVACIGYSSTNPGTTERFAKSALDIADKIATLKNEQAEKEMKKSFVKAFNNAAACIGYDPKKPEEFGKIYEKYPLSSQTGSHRQPRRRQRRLHRPCL